MNASAPLDSLLQIATTIEAEEERACSKLRMLAGELFNMRMFTNSLSITVDNTMTHLEGRCMSHGRKQAGEAARLYLEHMRQAEQRALAAWEEASAGAPAGEAGGK